MGTIIRKNKVYGEKGEQEIEILLDTGATRSFIKKEIVSKVTDRIHKLIKPVIFTLGNGKSKLEVKEMVTLFFYLEGYEFFYNFIVSENLAKDMILGTDFIQLHKIKLDLEKERIIIDEKALELILV